MKSNGPALLFKNVVGKNAPVLINAFGSTKRMALALGINDVEDIAREIEKLLPLMKPPKSFKDKLHRRYSSGGYSTEESKRRRLP